MSAAMWFDFAMLKKLGAVKLQPLEFRVWRRMQTFNRLQKNPQKILIACSGGMDSVALVHVLNRLSQRMNFSIALAHIHHGPSRNSETEFARGQAQETVASLAKDLGLEFFTLKAEDDSLSSESQLRSFRLRSLQALSQSHEFTLVAFAHHQDDLLETRLIRLVRGTGPVGLRAMKEISATVIRPFLIEKRSAVEAYARSMNLIWSEDPSNKDQGPLRNWMRTVWLPQLEQKRNGALSALARSLSEIANTCDQAAEIQQSSCSLNYRTENGSIDLTALKQLPLLKQRAAIADFMRLRGIRDFSQAHVEEVLKRIESVDPKSRKLVRFRLLKMQWQINARQAILDVTETTQTSLNA